MFPYTRPRSSAAATRSSFATTLSSPSTTASSSSLAFEEDSNNNNNNETPTTATMDRYSFDDEIWKRATKVNQQRQRRQSGGNHSKYHLDEDPTMSESTTTMTMTSTTEEDEGEFFSTPSSLVLQADTPRSLLVETGQESDDSERNYIRAYRKLIQIQQARSDIMEGPSHSSNEEDDEEEDDDKNYPDETLSSSAYTEEEDEEVEETEESLVPVPDDDDDIDHEEEDDDDVPVKETPNSKISMIDYNAYRNAVNSQHQKKKYLPSNGTETTISEVPKRQSSADYSHYRQAIIKQQQKKGTTVLTDNRNKPSDVDYSAYQNAIQQQKQMQDSTPQQQEEKPSSQTKSPPSSPAKLAIVEKNDEEPRNNGNTDATFILVLCSTLGSQHRTREQRALMWLDSLGILYQRVDGSDPENKQQRNQLFEISRLRGEYPQFFVVTNSGHDATATNFTSHNTKFLGDYDTVEGIHDASSLPAEILEANPNIITWDRIPGLQRKQ
jgi:hypothetical protein